MPEPEFQNRSLQEEIMDDLNCQGPVVLRTLKELDIINSWLGGNAITLNAADRFLEKLNSEIPSKNFRVADLGCGGGEMLKLIAQRARKKNISVDLVGVDANPFIIDYARDNARDFDEIYFIQQDVLSEGFKKERFDIVNCTLFCHHFTDNALIELLQQLASQTNYGIIINDIHRHWLAYHSIKWLTYFFSSSAMVKNDAKVSVLRAFTKKELESILKRAGFKHFTIEWKWAFRYEVIIYLKNFSH